MLELRDIHTHYGLSHVLQGVSLHVNAGEVVGLFGRNGVGKTTVMKTIAGWVAPSRGTVQLEGQAIGGVSSAGAHLPPRHRLRARRPAHLPGPDGAGEPGARLHAEPRPQPGEKNWVNYAEITSATDSNGGPRTDADSNPGSNGPSENAVQPGDTADNNLTSTDKGGEEDDHDPAGIEIYDLAQRKVTTATGPFRYGDMVKFTYEVFNQGSIQASGIDLVDYIPCGFKYVAASNDPLGWSYNATTKNASVTLPGSLVPGASQTIDIFLQVQPCIPTSGNAWTNIAEITGGDSDDPSEPPTDIDSTPDTNPNNDPGGQPARDQADHRAEPRPTPTCC